MRKTLQALHRAKLRRLPMGSYGSTVGKHADTDSGRCGGGPNRLVEMRRAIVATVALAALAFAGVATAYALGTITLRGGQCVRIGKTRVCAARSPARTVTNTKTVTSTATSTVTVTTIPTPVAAFSDGTYRVGINIQPGTYQASTPADCYWARLSGFSGGIGDIIANDIGVGIVTIQPSDIGFESQRCGSWSKIG